MEEKENYPETDESVEELSIETNESVEEELSIETDESVEEEPSIETDESVEEELSTEMDESTEEELSTEMDESAEKQKKLPTSGGYSKFFIYSTIVIFAFFAGFIFIKNYTAKMSEYKEKIAQYDTVQNENLKLEQENSALKQQIAYLKTKSGVESVAREKLGLIKPSEIAIVVLNDEKNQETTQRTNSENMQPTDTGEKDKSNKNSEGWFTKMWNSLFGH